MNPDNSTPTVPPPAEAPPIPAPLTPILKPPSSHARTGKVARLPKAIRDQINLMIQDGVPYLQIIDNLALQPHSITEDHLSTWKQGGYIDWTREQRLTFIIEKKHQLAESIVKHAADDNAASQAVLHVIANNLCEFLVETDPETIRESLLSDSDKFTRFVNAMVRLAEGSIKCGLYNFRAEDRAAEAVKAKNPTDTPGISDEALNKAEQKLKLL